jgi:hypothetical protein
MLDQIGQQQSLPLYGWQRQTGQLVQVDQPIRLQRVVGHHNSPHPPPCFDSIVQLAKPHPVGA